MSHADLIARLRAYQENVSNEMIAVYETPKVCQEAADALEKLTQPDRSEPVDVIPVAKVSQAGIIQNVTDCPFPPDYELYAGDTVARLQQERDVALAKVQDAGFIGLGLIRERDTMQEQVNSLRHTVSACGNMFLHYHVIHAAKEPTPENVKKAEANFALAEMCEKALAATESKESGK